MIKTLKHALRPEPPLECQEQGIRKLDHLLNRNTCSILAGPCCCCFFFFFPWDILELHKNRSIVLRAGFGFVLLYFGDIELSISLFYGLCFWCPVSEIFAYLKVTKIFFYDFRSDLDGVSFFVYIYDPLDVNFCMWDHTRAEVITSSLLELPWPICQQISVCVGWFQDSLFCSMSLCVEYHTVLITVTL